MSRNDYAHFYQAPQVDIQRSTFDLSSKVLTSFNVGDIVPIYCLEVLPGDEFEVKTSKVVRMQTLKTPIMDDLVLDTYFFFCPDRILWSHFKNFMGENGDSAWIPQVEYSVPQITSPSGGWTTGTIADYLGIPTNVANLSVNALPFRAYAKIVDDWFRNENLQDPLVIEYGDSTVAGSNGDTYVTDVAKGGKPYKANKLMDYFTSCLPSPQKGPNVSILSFSSEIAPVYAMNDVNSKFRFGNTSAGSTSYKNAVKASYPVLFADVNGSTTSGYAPQPMAFAHASQNGSTLANQDVGYNIANATLPYNTKESGSAVNILGKSLSTLEQNQVNNSVASGDKRYYLTPVNLVAESSGWTTSINDLRQAFQIQRFYEREARSGSRYIELIASMFKVTNPDYRVQRPEYLGGNRVPINIKQITQTSSTTENQPLGDVAGMSITTDNNYDFHKAFTEHGFIIGVCVARYHHTYQQGLERMWTRTNRFHYYWPTFAHLGEQSVKRQEIYATSSYNQNITTFGYQEAWAEYRYKPNIVTGMMRSSANTGLDTWHFADDYNSAPTLSASWIVEDKNNVDRTLTVTSSTANQLFCDIWVDNTATRAMPLYSIPGLMDHY